MTTSDDNDDRRWMTPLLNRIADVAGLEAAIAIGRAKAGQQISIPKKSPPGHWLHDLVGADAAAKIVETFQDTKIIIPVTLTGAKRQRAEAIAQMAASGYSLNKIVQLTGLSRSTVRAHIDKLDLNTSPRQGSLF